MLRHHEEYLKENLLMDSVMYVNEFHGIVESKGVLYLQDLTTSPCLVPDESSP
jgi:hypothetical protein